MTIGFPKMYGKKNNNFFFFTGTNITCPPLGRHWILYLYDVRVYRDQICKLLN